MVPTLAVVMIRRAAQRLPATLFLTCDFLSSSDEQKNNHRNHHCNCGESEEVDEEGGKVEFHSALVIKHLL